MHTHSQQEPSSRNGYKEDRCLQSFTPTSSILVHRQWVSWWMSCYQPGRREVNPVFCSLVSQNKFFGPQMGVLYGSYNLFERLTAYKIRPAPQDLLGKFEAAPGTSRACVGCWERWSISNGWARGLGLSMLSSIWVNTLGGTCASSRRCQRSAVTSSRLSQALLDILAETPGVKVYSIKDTYRMEEQRPPACSR